jgi:hypothetical protein
LFGRGIFYFPSFGRLGGFRGRGIDSTEFDDVAEGDPDGAADDESVLDAEVRVLRAKKGGRDPVDVGGVADPSEEDGSLDVHSNPFTSGHRASMNARVMSCLCL